MKSSLLRLDRYWLKSISVSENSAFDPASTGVPVFESTTSRAQKAEDPKYWKVDLEVRTPEKNNSFQPYNVIVKLSGIFEVPNNLDWEVVVAVNAPAVLFGAAREIIATVTSRGSFPAMVLPSVTFMDEAPKKDESKESSKQGD